ncbi:MAG: hypothetical protein ACQER9_04740 [Nanobdellota archaeon]
MKTNPVYKIIVLFFLFSVFFISGCGDERPIPGDNILTIYNSNMEETRELAPLDTMYVKVAALGPGKYYEISVKDSEKNIISKIEERTDDEGVIGPAALWYDVGLKNKNGVPVVEQPENLDIMPFTISVKSINDDYTDFSQDMWIRYKNTDIDTNPKPVVYSGYMESGNFQFSNAFDETGSKQEDGTTDSVKTKVYVKAETVPEKVGNIEIATVDFYIMPFIGGIIADGTKLQAQTDENIFIGPVTAAVDDGKVGATKLWDLNDEDNNLINPGQDSMAYTIVMDVDRDGIYDAGMDTNSDGLIDSYIDGVDGLGVPGFVVMNTPANNVFVTVKDGTGESANITNSIPESGQNKDLYINIENFAADPGENVKIYLKKPDGTYSEPVSAAVKPASYSEGKYLPYIENVALISNFDAGAGIKTPDVEENTKYGIWVDSNGNDSQDDEDIILEDYITVVHVPADPEYKTYSDSSALNETLFFDETGTENGNCIVYLKAEDQTKSYDAYVIKNKNWENGDYISGSLVSKTGSAENTLSLWDLNNDHKVINPDTQNNTYDVVIDNNQNGIYDEGIDDIVSVVILNTEANTYPRVSYVNIASGGVFGNTYAQHWTLYSEYCDYRDVFTKDAYETNYKGGGYGVKAVFNPYFKWWGNEPEIETEGLYYGLYVDVYIVSTENFDLTTFGRAGELNDQIDARGRHSTLSVQPSCYNGAGLMTIWTAPLDKGEYYVIVDVNRNGRIDEGIDIIDAVDKSDKTILDDPEIVGFKVE